MDKFKKELNHVMQDSEDYLKKLVGEKAPEINQDMLDLTKKIIELKERHAKLKRESAEIWLQKESLEQNLIEQMETLNLKNFRHKEFGLISVGQRIWGKIADIGEAQKYFESEGIASQLLAVGLKKGSGQARLNEIIRNCVEEGKMVPTGLDFSNRATIIIRKG